ncbi:MAG TPA: glycosyltransferase family 2 protein [Planctomycetota bacterium]|nr:glycosyltransferase family 2 protein [Planctomycetota bacterium]
MMTKDKTEPDRISIVVPMYNEADGVAEFHRRVTAVMGKLGREYEMVLVDDGSTDGTLAALKALAEKDAHVAVVELRRNFGQTAALAAGFDHATGKVIVAMDGDLENVPEDIPRFLEKIDEGYDIVSGWRRRRAHGFFLRRLPSRAANWLMRKMSGVALHDFGCTFKAYRRDMLDEVHLYGEMHRFIPALANLAGARVSEIEVQHVDRPYGRSKYGIGRTPRVFMDLVTIRFMQSYLTRPLHLFGLTGLALFVIGCFVNVYLLVRKLFFGVHLMTTHGPLMIEHGPLMILGVMLVLMGIIFFMTGLLGEILVRTYHEATGRKIYTVRKVHRGGKDVD